jgi:hypothetical protein
LQDMQHPLSSRSCSIALLLFCCCFATHNPSNTKVPLSFCKP